MGIPPRRLQVQQPAGRRSFETNIREIYVGRHLNLLALGASFWSGARVRAYAPLFQGLRTTFPCVFEGLSRELSSHYIIRINYNRLYSPIHYRKVANM